MSKQNLRNSEKYLKLAKTSGSAICYDSESNKYTTIDFVKLGFPISIAKAYALSYYISHSASSHNTHRSHKLILNQISRYHKELNIRKLSDISTKKILKIIDWLKNPETTKVRKRSKSYMHGIFTLNKNILKNIPLDHSIINSNIKWPANPFPYKNKSQISTKTPSKETYDSLHRIMLQEYQTYQKRLNIGRAIRENRITKHSPINMAIRDLIRNEQDFFKAKYPIPQSPEGKLIEKLGGVGFLSSYLYPTRNYIAPIYQLILMESGANPTSIIELEIGCIQPIPLVSKEANLIIKKRRGYKIYTTQMSRHGRNSPIKILESLISEIKYLQSLKICSSNRIFQDSTLYANKRKPGPIENYTALKPRLRTLSKVNNVPLESMSGWRNYHLTKIYDISGNVLEAKTVANHADVRTTRGYIDKSVSNQRIKTSLISITTAHIETIKNNGVLKFEGELIKRKTKNIKHTASYGMNCKNPFEGMAPGSVEGELCPGFLRCFTCENAVIPINMETCIRLLQLRDHLKREKPSIHEERWTNVYDPIYKIIKHQILRNFSKIMKETAAKKLSSLAPLPKLT